MRITVRLFAGLRDLGMPELQRYVADYRAAWRGAGHPGRGDVCVRIPIYLAPTEREACEEPRDGDGRTRRGGLPRAVAFDAAPLALVLPPLAPSPT